MNQIDPIFRYNADESLRLPSLLQEGKREFLHSSHKTQITLKLLVLYIREFYTLSSRLSNFVSHVSFRGRVNSKKFHSARDLHANYLEKVYWLKIQQCIILERAPGLAQVASTCSKMHIYHKNMFHYIQKIHFILKFSLFAAKFMRNNLPHLTGIFYQNSPRQKSSVSPRMFLQRCVSEVWCLLSVKLPTCSQFFHTIFTKQIRINLSHCFRF